MAYVGSYSVGGTYSDITLSRQYTTVDELLIGLPYNQAGLIKDINIRDSVYSLWQKIESVSASSSVTFSVDYIRPVPTTISVGGISSGTTFNGSVQDVLDLLLYPYVGPGASLTSWSQKEYGDPSGYSFNLNWSATENSNSIISITVSGFPQSFPPFSNSQTVTSTHSSVNPDSAIGTQQTYFMSVSDNTTSTNASTTVTWLNRVYWGRIDLLSIQNPNLTTNPGSASLVGGIVTSFIVRNLNGAGANGLPEVSGVGSSLSNTKSQTLSNINGNGQHLIFAWPSNIAGAYTPAFTVNGLPNTAFTRVKTNWAFTNQYSFSGSDYEVWVSNTVQNSPITVVIS